MFAVAAVVVAVAGGAGAYAVWIHPWLALPAPEDEIDAAWDDARQWALEGAGTVELEGARRAARMIRPRAAELRDELMAADTDLPEIPEDQLQAGERGALAELVAWSEAAPQVDGDPCGDIDISADPASIELLTLGQLALASSASDPRSPRARAVARLGHHLRNRGSLLDAMIGAALADSLASWAQSREVPLPAAVAASITIREADFFSVLAREAYCAVEWVAAEFAAESERAGGAFAGLEGGGPPWAIVRPRREVLVVKAYYADLLARIHPHRHDLTALAEELDAIAEEEPLAKSLLLDVLRGPYASHARQWADHVAATAPAAVDAGPDP